MKIKNLKKEVHVPKWNIWVTMANKIIIQKYYNLDMIISIGFRVNSTKAIKFRTWANKIIKDYMVQGFALNDERFLKAKIDKLVHHSVIMNI